MKNALSLALKVKIGAIVVHADELTSPGGRLDFDGPAIRTLVEDVDVQEWLNSFDAGLLPVKREPVEESET